MTNKKTIILGLIGVAFIAGLVWYANQYGLSKAGQIASVFNNDSKNENGENNFPSVGGEFFFGDPNAPVTMIEYSSHLCGQCASFHSETLPLLLDNYVKEGKLKIIPRRLSPSELGQAIICAQEQEKFQEMDEYLFEHSQDLVQKANEAGSADEIDSVVSGWLEEAAGNLGLDKTAFGQCLESKKYEEKIIAWFDQSGEQEVKGTPTFYINDLQIVGSQPYFVFEEAINQALSQ